MKDGLKTSIKYNVGGGMLTEKANTRLRIPPRIPSATSGYGSLMSSIPSIDFPPFRLSEFD